MRIRNVPRILRALLSMARPTYVHPPFATRSFCVSLSGSQVNPGSKLPWSGGEAEVDSCVLIQLRCSSEVKVVRRDFTMMPVPDIERGPSQNIVMNLLRRAAILKEESNRLLAVWGWRLVPAISRRPVRPGGRGLPLINGRCIVSLRCVVRRSRRIVIAECVWVSHEIRTHPSRKHVGNSGSIGRSVWSSVVRVAGIRCASAETAGPNSVQAACRDGRYAAGIARGACESIGSRSAEASARNLSAVTREACARCTPLSANWNRYPRENQRECSQTIHGKILRLFGKSRETLTLSKKAHGNFFQAPRQLHH
jgi:hypothetical protein